MKTMFLTASRRAGWGNRLMRKLKLGFWTACMAGMLALPALATTRNWTGANSGNWSDPNNWSPGGTPADGDYLQFGMMADAHRTMNNDIAGLEVAHVVFVANDYTLNGYTLLLNGAINGGIDGDVGELTANSYTVTINCALIFSGGGHISAHTGDGTFTQSTEQVFLNGPIEVDNGNLLFEATSEAVSSVGGGNGKIFATSQITGSGSVVAFATEVQGNVSSVEFNGGSGNTFAGTLYLLTQGNGQIVFNKSAGVVATNRVAVTGGQTANLRFGNPNNQIANNGTLLISDGSQLRLSGNNVTVGTLILTNNPSDITASTLDTGSTTLSLNAGIISSVNNDHVYPAILGWLSLNGFLPVNIGNFGGAEPGLNIAASISGNGFQKLGNGILILSANNTFFGDCEITVGTVQITTPLAFGVAGPTYGVELDGGNLQMQGLAIGNEPLYVNSPNSTLIAYDACSWSGPVTLNANFNVLPADTTSTGQAMNFTGVITGTGGITMLDSAGYNGTLLLSGSSANTYTGTTTVYGRLLELGKPASVNACSGPLVVGGGTAAISELRWLNNYQEQLATLTLYANGYVNLINHDENFGPVTFNGGTVDSTGGQFAISAPLTVNPSSSSATINGILGLPPGNNAVLNVGAGSTPSGLDLVVNAVVIGAAPYFDKQGAGTMSLTAANIFTGVTLLEAGIIAANNASAMSTTPMVIFGGATLQLNVNCTLNQNMEIYGAGVGGTDGALQLSPGVSALFLGTILLDGATSINIGSGAELEPGGVIWGAGPLTKTGLGILNVAGPSANTYSGDTLINQGTLYLNKSSVGAASVPGNLVIGTRTSPFGNSGTTATATHLQSGSIAGTNVTVNGGSLWDLNGYNESLVSVNLHNGGSIHTETGQLALNSNGGVTPTLTVSPGQSGASVVSGNLYIPSGCNFEVAARQFSLVGSGPELDLQAAISQATLAASIQKDGAGRMRLSAANTYTGSTIVNGGILQVDGTQPQSAVQVNGGTLQGIGTVGPISMTASAAAVAPGGSPGILTCDKFGNSGGSGILNVELDGTTPGTGYDQLNVLGTVNLSGVTLTGTLNFASSIGDRFTIINNDGIDAVGGTFNGLPHHGNVYLSGQLFQITYTGGTGNDVELTHLATPPPPTLTIAKAPPASVRLLWATNNPPFSLQVCTNLAAASWTPALPLPVVIGGQNVVTNSITGAQGFYRLSSP